MTPSRPAWWRPDQIDLPAAGDVPAAIEFARTLVAPMPGSGSTLELWRRLAALGAHDLELVRVVEPHLDALAILDQANVEPLGPGRVWGVFAAEATGYRLAATRTDDGWVLDGVKPWCSLAGRIDAALVTAHADGGRQLFAVDLTHDGIEVDESTWSARGLSGIPSGPVRFTTVPVEPIGVGEWYLTRPGFTWGGIGVAACWFGGALALGEAIRAAASARPTDQILAMHLGAVDIAMHAARLALEDAAGAVDAGEADSVLAGRVRAIVAATCENVITIAGHALGPTPLATDAVHAKRVADLTLYIRQHHAEGDLASLGSRIAASTGAPW